MLETQLKAGPAITHPPIVVDSPSQSFVLPPDLEARVPAEARGLRRDEVRLMVSDPHSNRIQHDRFTKLADYLNPGDVLVINTSGTLKAALNATRADGTPIKVHLSTRLTEERWVIEPRTITARGTQPLLLDSGCNETIRLPLGASAHLLQPHAGSAGSDRARLWEATLDLPYALLPYLEAFGTPIRYDYVSQSWPIDYYQTVYATEPGSAEMPSAGRAFTAEMITEMVAEGIQFAPLLLHTGVASQEAHEPPYAEYYRVPAESAELINQAHQHNHRVIAVGTTAVRALETLADREGKVSAGEGWTELVITPERGIRAVNGLLTGFHEPEASHLMMLEALTGRDHLQLAYTTALEHRYLWHEFGDLHLILPAPAHA